MPTAFSVLFTALWVILGYIFWRDQPKTTQAMIETMVLFTPGCVAIIVAHIIAERYEV
jgi:hypothetical protein